MLMECNWYLGVSLSRCVGDEILVVVETPVEKDTIRTARHRAEIFRVHFDDTP